MNTERWKLRLREWRGERAIENDLSPYRPLLERINGRGEIFAKESDGRLKDVAASLRKQARNGGGTSATEDDLLVEVFALAREAADRVLGMRPFDVQVIDSVARHWGQLVEVHSGVGAS